MNCGLQNPRYDCWVTALPLDVVYRVTHKAPDTRCHVMPLVTSEFGVTLYHQPLSC